MNGAEGYRFPQIPQELQLASAGLPGSTLRFFYFCRKSLEVYKSLPVLLVLLFVTMYATSQDTAMQVPKRPHKNFLIHDRPWEIEVPLWIPGFAGELVYGDIDLEGEDGEDPGDPGDPGDGTGNILSRIFTKDWYLKFLFLGRATYENKGLLFQFDGFGGGIAETVKFKLTDKGIVQLNFRILNFRIVSGYRLWQKTSGRQNFRYELYGYVGARVHANKIDSDLNNFVNRLDINPVWMEPIIGIQNQFNFKRWKIILQGDYGGLFVHTKYSSLFQTMVYYRTGRVTSLKLGWNHLNLNHESTFRGEYLKVGISLSGPAAGLTFHF